jgi:hypothetical protein
LHVQLTSGHVSGSEWRCGVEWHIGNFKAHDRHGAEYSVDAFKHVVFPPEAPPEQSRVVTDLRLDGRQLNYLGRGTYVLVDDWGQRIVLEADDPKAP